MIARRSFLAAAAAIVIAGSVTGCASRYMRAIDRPPPLAPQPDVATVVFVRPSAFAAAIHPTILDGRGRFLGEANASSHFAVALPPGEHLFVAWGENTGPLRAYLEAGRVYFVEVATKPGWVTARVHLLAITPRSEQWSEVRGWLADTTATATDGPAGQAYLDERAEDVAERIRRAKEALTEMSAEELEERTIRPTDGIGETIAVR